LGFCPECDRVRILALTAERKEARRLRIARRRAYSPFGPIAAGLVSFPDDAA
jgi:hypothetical protein